MKTKKQELMELVRIVKKENKTNLMITLEILDDVNNRQMFERVFAEEIEEEIKKLESQINDNDFNQFIDIDKQAVRNVCKKFITGVGNDENVTTEQIKAFEEARQSGKFNMITDVEQILQEPLMQGITKEQYFAIIKFLKEENENI